MQGFRNFFCVLICYFLIFCCFFIVPNKAFANSKFNLDDQKKEIKRSIESLRDLDYQTWQVIVYPSSKDSKKLTLRIVGYPGSLRIDHPTNLIVNSGIKTWNLRDITKNGKTSVEILNDSAAEYDLSPLILELDKNRPLRLRLPGLINELPIPPYLVSEWRSLMW
tara:strand:- start:74 stop:568 length:495 start_codon:yes stop_codon:yes gene_type:complete